MAKGMVWLHLALPFSTRWLLPNEGDDACLSLRRRIAGPLASIAQQSDELGSGGGSVFSWLRSGHFARLMGAHPVTSPLVANRSLWRSAVLIHDKSGALHRLYRWTICSAGLKPAQASVIRLVKLKGLSIARAASNCLIRYESKQAARLEGFKARRTRDTLSSSIA